MEQHIDLTKSTGIECSECNGIFFEQSMILRRFSKIYTATSTDQIAPVVCFTCKDCGSPLKEFFPEGMPDVEQRLGLTKQASNPLKIQM
jgi:hypothetical protein